jgi:adhesin/invasin
VPLLVALGIGSCDASPVLFPEASSVEVTNPSGSVVGVAGEVLLPAPEVRIRDGSGNPVPGVLVTLQVTDGGGAVSGTTRTSDRQGTVSLSGWRLGQAAGANTLEVRVADRGEAAPGPDAPAAVVTAVGEAGPPSRIEPLVTGVLRGPVGGPVDASIRFRVTDRFENPVPSWEILFEPLPGSGSVSPASGTTGADGIVGPVTWTLGTAAGTQGLQATATGVFDVSVTIEAEAEPGPPAELRIDGTPPAEGIVGEPVDLGVDALVLDAFGNPVTGIVVTFTPDPGSGVVSDSVGTTDEDGRVPVPVWTLGTLAGPQTLVVRAGELDPVRMRPCT